MLGTVRGPFCGFGMLRWPAGMLLRAVVVLLQGTLLRIRSLDVGRRSSLAAFPRWRRSTRCLISSWAVFLFLFFYSG